MIRASKLVLYGNVMVRWVPSYMLNSVRGARRPIHIIFCLVDHFEPGTGGVSVDTEKERMRKLLSEFPKLVDKHKDVSGRGPRRTWFFPPHYHRNGNLRELVSLCEEGYGEIELHLHHGKIRGDTSENLEASIWQCIEEYSQFGIFGTEGGRRRYGFIHGDWALDNSRRGRYCGVNDEIRILRKTGCYADFTFPSMNESNPKLINCIYYATDNPVKPKSYNKGVRVSVSNKPKGDLMIIQGPIHPYRAGKGIRSMRVVGDSIGNLPRVTRERVDLWVKAGIHVEGKRDWVFIKTHTHGAIDDDVVLGDEIDRMYDYLESKYNDGSEYILHYVTAREMYNIISALEANEKAVDPDEYRDYKIRPPRYDSSAGANAASDELRRLIGRTYGDSCWNSEEV